MESWRLIRSGPLSGAMNMALDEALLEAVARGCSAPLLRLYRWQPATLTLGYSQRPTEVDLEACQELQIDLVRRPTGGRAVLHDREATYAVVAPVALFPGGLLGSYRAIALALRQALADLGMATELQPGRQRNSRSGGANCFAAPSSWELVFQGCKVAGSAQKRAGGAFLQHGSIPVELDLPRLSRLLRPAAAPAEDPERLLECIGWLNRWCRPAVTVQQVEEALVDAFGRELGIDFRQDQPSAAEWSRAQVLAETKYGNREWTLQSFRTMKNMNADNI